MYVVKTGKDRIVVVFPFLGIVLKVARFGPRNIMGILKTSWRSLTFPSKRIGDFYKSKFDMFEKQVKFFELRTILANLIERRVWKKTKNQFLWPCWVSFFGIVNVYPYAKCVMDEGRFKDSEMWTQINFFSESYCWESGHTFSEASNFCVDDKGKVRMLDYGFWCSEEIIKRYGNALFENLDPNKKFTDAEKDQFWSEIQKNGRALE